MASGEITTDFDLSGVQCPSCKQVGTLTLKERLKTKPLGSFSLSGNQVKVSVAATLFLVCPCGFEEEGKPNHV